MADERVNNTWDPQQFPDLQRNDLKEEFEKIKSRHESRVDMNEGEPSTRQTEVLVDEHVKNTWYPHQFLQRNDLIEEFKKIESRLHESATVTPTIFRVPTHLNSSYVSACKPVYISIGPYNRGEPKLEFMEAYKLHYLYELRKRVNSGRWQIEEFVDLLRTELKKIESRARSCYSDSINMENRDEFVEMMLVDGCFIVEYMFKLQPDEMTPPILSTRWGWMYVLRDLILLENQLPFFVLESIYRKVIDNSDGARDALIEKLHNLLFNLTPFEKTTRFIPEQTPDHLLHLFHLSLIGDHDDNPNTQIPQALCNDIFYRRLVHLFHLSLTMLSRVNDRNTVDVTNMFYRKATELELSGVKFKKKDDGRLLQVSFHNGILEMSPLTLNEFSNTSLRNFVALEQCNRKYGMHFTSYMFFIDNLVDSNKDVELLIKRGIFHNDMGSNKVVVKHFFDRLSNDMVYDDIPNRHLRNALVEMEKYCAKFWPEKRAMLFRDYFNSPWSYLSFFAAVLLLALTMLQTSGTIYSYIKKN